MLRYYTPAEFQFLKEEAQKMGFRHVESGPLVRSSYHAHEQAESTRAVGDPTVSSKSSTLPCFTVEAAPASSFCLGLPG